MKYKGYKLVRVLGEGGNSTAFLARDLKTGKKVTIKQLKRDVGPEYAIAKMSMES